MWWSCWYTILAPLKRAGFKPRGTKLSKHGQLKGFRLDRRILKSLILDNEGIYELGLGASCWQIHPKAVYIGRANYIQERILKYCYDGSHKRKNIDEALENGFDVRVRFFPSRNSRALESSVLEMRKYQWNTQTPKVSARGQKSAMKLPQLLLPYNETECADFIVNLPCETSTSRNLFSPDDPLFPEWNDKWSEWFTIISPHDISFLVRIGHKGPPACFTVTDRLNRHGGGIYELLMHNPFCNRHHMPSTSVVYLGTAYGNTRLCNTLNRCSNNDGMHPTITYRAYEAALQGSTVQARVLGWGDIDGNAGLSCPVCVRERVLERFDYPWNYRMCSHSGKSLS